MRKDVFMAGMGGQGVLLIGQLLTQAALEDGFEASWFPIYSPEVRGGSSTCTVVISDGAVGSPIIGRPGVMLLMDQNSVNEHMARLRDGGLLLLNSSLIRCESPEGVQVFRFPASEKAVEMGHEKVTNMIMLGAYLELEHKVNTQTLEEALRVVLAERHHRFIPLNIEAVQVGAAMAREAAQ